MDNNFFASPEWSSAIETLLSWNQPVNFHQGIDIRLMDGKKWGALLSLKHEGQIHAAWDNPKEDLRPLFIDALDNIKPSRLMVYVLIGYNSTHEENLMRVQWLNDHNIDPFAMPFNKNDPYQKAFARWVNHKAVFNSVSWEDYNSGLGRFLP